MLGLTSNCLFYTVVEEWFLISTERVLHLGEALHAISPYSVVLKFCNFNIFNLMPYERQTVSNFTKKRTIESTTAAQQ